MTRPWEHPLERAAPEDAGRRSSAMAWLDPFSVQEDPAPHTRTRKLAVSAFANCAAPQNPSRQRNCLPGTPTSVWYLENQALPIFGGSPQTSV